MSAIALRTSLDSAMAFDSGAWKMAIATAGLLLRRLRSAYSPAPSSMRATSFNRSTPPSADVETMMLPNSSSVVSLP